MNTDEEKAKAQAAHEEGSRMTRRAIDILHTPVAEDNDKARLQALDLRLRASWLGRQPADPLTLGFATVAMVLGRAEAAGADEATRQALAIVAPEILPAGATPFERGLTMGLALALLTEGHGGAA